MIDRIRFDLVKSKHGHYGSWAIWAGADGAPKSNVGDLSVLDPDLHPSLLERLQNSFVMVALNFSQPVFSAPPFHNFHSASGKAQDYKIRYAFANTPYSGAYMTDFVKNFPMLKASDVRRHLTAQLARANADSFLEELSDLGAVRPTVLAFGRDAHDLIARFVPPSAFAKLVRLPHYSMYISQEQYRDVVARELASS